MNLELTDSAATSRLGEALAATFPGAQAGPVVVYLNGELGAGKTTCVRSLLLAMGVAGTVRSPSYTLVETYAAGDWRAIHIDLYRLRDPGEYLDLGLVDELLPGRLWLIEWPDHGGDRVPAPDLVIRLEYAGGGRRAQLVAHSAPGRIWLEKLAQDVR